MSVQTRSLEELLEGVMLKVFARLFVARPGKVERYDESSQQADVRPLLRETSVGADGDSVVESPALVQNVPVVFPSASGGFLSFGLEVGDTVLLVYVDRSLDRWKSLGDEVDPVDVRRHHPSDAIAIVGLHAFNAPLPGVSRTDAVLSVKAGAKLLLGASDATDGVARASVVEGKLTALANALTAGSVSDITTLKASIAALLATPWPGSVGSSVVKVTP